MIGDIYVFCGDINGMMPINLGAPKISGTNQIGLKDTNGKPIMPEFIKIATSKKGEGFTEYFWRNPKTKLVNPKTTFIKAINSQYFVGVGYFGTED
jgi:methyl-accepting chemotaxis protein